MAFEMLLLRHGPAGERETFKKTGKPDSLRPLTRAGEKEVRRVARFLKKRHELDVILTSPYTRAHQTAEILAAEFKAARVVILKELTPHTPPAKTLRALRRMGRMSNFALVGHEPHLTRFLTFTLTGRDAHYFLMKKSAFAAVEFPGRLETRHARLKCLVQPSLVRKPKKKSRRAAGP